MCKIYTFDELKEIVEDIDGVVVGVDDWNEDVFKLAPKLKGMARFGVGVDNIDLNAAKEHGIIVCNSPGINSSAVAEQAVALMLSLIRNIPEMNRAVRKGEWPRPMFHELKSRTIGFLGFGAIARNVAQRLAGFGPEMIAYDKYPNQEAADKLGVRLVSQEEVLKESDIISIHLPATDETKHLINKETIQQMKDGVYIVNTARGSIVNEADMAGALESGKAAGFGTDVFEHEPIDLSGPLFKYDNYIATPHVSAETFENCETTSVVTARALLAVFEGREPENRLV
ncbi:phosphoglycerate dehydrogenase [Mediterraneibacter glycyrrhizinilyticus]|uniref:phosphoglycerate dehydrogenase n=1 Tax=Mediterraneibacter glycyrrhizinilyticus TaxID=342942 RepID=UPI0025A3A143|nr:phosphoglycerate dehydrogenase [Mediterraneibacter glycyrrhizinilyticus]MDM8126459.1 phosphoglycerate dehydrogenase [Mediterraneibacter glycyrrhizinilyticus]MDM8211716.1 phosphoglycerate dehydrogenase [Mediterraneibacter glycyrrhizinilyticus]